MEGQSGHAAQIQATLEDAIKGNPDNATLRLLLGRFYLVSGKNQEALTAIVPALDKAPKDPALLEVAGRAQLALKNYNAAIRDFQTLGEVQPESSPAHRFLAETLGYAGRYDEAFTEARKALDLDPKDADAKVLLARLYLNQKSYEDAQKIADQLAVDLPKEPGIAELQAHIALVQNHLEDAIADYKRELTIVDNSYVRASLARTQAQAGRIEDAEATLLPWINEHPDDPVGRLTMGNIYVVAKRYADAQAQFAAVVEKNPDSAIGENNLAWLLSQEGQSTEALKHAQHAAQLAPTAPEVLDTLGIILLANGQTADAVDTLAKAVSAAPDGDPEIQFHLAQAQVKAGEKEGARQSLRAAIKSAHAFKDRAEAEKMLTELGS
jgi:putative PEP-CTERM system TPR-repeat lipoprotein